MNVFTGNYLTVFPVPNNANNKWVSAASPDLLSDEQTLFAQQTINNYLNTVAQNDWASANQVLLTLKENQKKHGAAALPSSSKIKMEVLYNNINIFGKLAKIFMFTGLILLFIQLTSVLQPKNTARQD